MLKCDQLIRAVKRNDIKKTKKILKSSNCVPFFMKNKAIKIAFENNYQEIFELLWSLESVKSSVFHEDRELYNNFNKVKIKNKIVRF